MTPVPQVRGSAYLPFVEFLDKADVFVERGIERDLVPAIVHRDGEALVPVHLAHSFLEKGARKLGRDDFGVLVGRNFQICEMGAFGRSLCRSLTLHDALTKLRSTFSLYSSAERVWWTQKTKETVSFCHAYVHKTGPGSRHARHCALLLMRAAVRLAAGSQWQPACVLVQDLDDILILKEEFSDPEFCRSEVSGFTFPASMLSLPLRQRGALSFAVPDKDAFDSATPSDDFLGSLRQVIATLLPEGQCGLEHVAQALGMHPRTLQRKLSALGQDYSELLSQIRYEKTLLLMQDPDFRIFDIALELGFQDASNFSRSFRQWTGVTPTEFRKTQQSRH